MQLIMFKSCVLLLIGYSLASISAKIVAQPANQPVANKTNNMSANQNAVLNPELVNDRHSAWQEEIEVLEPDGSIATNARYLVGRRHQRFQLDDSMEAVDLSAPVKPGITLRVETLRVEGGTLPLNFNPADEFIAVWSEKGFFQTSISRLEMAESIQLQDWVTLQIDLRTKDGPDEGVTVSVSNNHTTDGTYSAMTFCNEKVIADKNGKAVVKHVAPGGISIQTNVETIVRGNASWDQYERYRLVNAAPGETLQLTFGGTGRSIRGSVAFSKNSEDSDLDDLKGEVECKRTNERIKFNIAVNGDFECDEVPVGPCKITIRSRSNFDRTGVRRVYYGTKSFDCDANGSGILSIGIVPLERRGQREMPSPSIEKAATRDEFTSTRKVAVVATTKLEKSNYILLDDQCQSIRSLENIEVPGAWAFNFQFVAFDVERDRLYLLSAYDQISKTQDIYILDLSGKILGSRSLPTFGECRIAVDAASGDLWVLDVESIGKARTVVIDQQGNQTKTFYHSAFSLCYSNVDKAFWFVGSRTVTKVDPDTGETIASYDLPAGVFTISNVIPGPDGGVLALEGMHPDMPKSANRVWRFDSNAKRVASLDVGNTVVKSVAYIGDELWCSGVKIEGTWIANPKVTKVFLRFNRSLETLPDRKLDYSFLGSDRSGKSVWVLQGTELQRVTKNNDGPIQINSVGSIAIEAPIWASSQ